MSKRRSGWAAIPRWVLDDPSVSMQAKMTYLILSSHVGDDATCWPSQSSIAERLGCDVRSVQRHIRALVDHGLIVVTIRSTRRGRSNVYKVLSHPFFGEGGDDTSVGMGDDTSVPPSRTT